jgi:[protein-PII] uridylyltransferase
MMRAMTWGGLIMGMMLLSATTDTLSGAYAGQAAQTPTATFKSGIDLVRVSATVRDRRGRLVADLAPRLGFGPQDTQVLVTLVRHHLLLPDTATRRDPEDPATVAHVAAAVRTLEVLDLLHALTKADGAATGPAAWTDWKAALVADLVERTRALLGGHEVPAPPDLATTHADLLRARGLAVCVDARGADGVEVTVVAPDAVGLLGQVAGVLSLNRLAVRAASAQTADGMAVQVWQVQPEFGDAAPVERLREDVHRALAGTLDVAARLDEREAASSRRLGTRSAPPRVDVVAGASRTATVLEVRAHDRPGLLHRIGASLASLGVDVRSALVSTLGSEAVDVFYVVGPDGAPLSDDRARAVALELRAALA